MSKWRPPLWLTPKPVLFHRGRTWFCLGGNFCGVGGSAEAAYNNWFERWYL